MVTTWDPMNFAVALLRGIGDLFVFHSCLQHRVSTIASGTHRYRVSRVHGTPFL